MEEKTNIVEEFIRMLEKAAKPYPFLDPEYDILVVEESQKPIIIMNQDEYDRLWEKITGSKREE